MALPEQQAIEEIRVPLVFLDFQVWMVYLGTQGLLDSEANLARTAAMAQEVIQGFQEKEELLVSKAPQAFLGKKERKEIHCSFSVALKVFRVTEETQDLPAYQDQGVVEDRQAQWDTQESRGYRDLGAVLGARV